MHQKKAVGLETGTFDLPEKPRPQRLGQTRGEFRRGPNPRHDHQKTFVEKTAAY
jgi:hypothetical protein